MKANWGAPRFPRAALISKAFMWEIVENLQLNFNYCTCFVDFLKCGIF